MPPRGNYYKFRFTKGFEKDRVAIRENLFVPYGALQFTV